MFKGAGSQGDLNGFLDAGSHMNGELQFEDTFRIDGKLTGNVVSKGELIIGERGELDGEVRVGKVFVSGAVRGTVRASDRVEITSAGKVTADIFTPTLSIEDGAFFEGRCTMVRESEAERPDLKKVAKMPIAKER